MVIFWSLLSEDNLKLYEAHAYVPHLISPISTDNFASLAGTFLMNALSWKNTANLLIALTLLSTSLSLPWPAAAAPPTVPSSCSLQRITKKTFSSLSLNNDGSRLAVATSSSQQKKNRQPWQEPLYTEEFSIFDTQRRKQRKIAKAQYEGRRRIPSAQISADGSRIVFSSGGNFTGENPDGNTEVFLFDTITRSIYQVTKTTEGDNDTVTISISGERVAFLSTEYSVKDGVEDTRTILSLFDVSTKQITQVAQTRGVLSSIWDVSLNSDGSQLAFASNLNPTGSNPDGTFEIFLWNVTTQVVTQITNATSSETNSGNSFSPIISADGTRVVFQSTVNLTGENLDENIELFLFDSRTGGMTQLTHSTGNSGLFAGYSISADGTKLVFEGNKDLLTGNIDNVSDANDSEVFLMDIATRIITQLTYSSGTSFSPTVSTDGKSIAFTSAQRYFVLLGSLGSFTPPPDPDAGTYLAACP